MKYIIRTPFNTQHGQKTAIPHLHTVSTEKTIHLTHPHSLKQKTDSNSFITLNDVALTQCYTFAHLSQTQIHKTQYK